MHNLMNDRAVFFLILLALLLSSSCSKSRYLDVHEFKTNEQLIVVWGHSAGVIIEPYLESILNEEQSDYVLNRRSVRGESILQIAARQGSIPCRFNVDWADNEDEHLIASSTNKLVSTYNGEIMDVNPVFGYNPCYISGEKGVLKRDGDLYYFTSGSKTKSNYLSGSHLIIPNDAFVLTKGCINIFWCDQQQDRKDIVGLVDIYKRMTKFTGNQKYLIIGSIRGDRNSQAELEKEMETHFNGHYFNAREYLIREASKYSMDIIISSADEERLNQGKVPSYFMEDDDIHLNALGAKLVASQVFELLTSHFMD